MQVLSSANNILNNIKTFRQSEEGTRQRALERQSSRAPRQMSFAPSPQRLTSTRRKARQVVKVEVELDATVPLEATPHSRVDAMTTQSATVEEVITATPERV